MAGSQSAALESLNEGLDKLQSSARRTLPVFLVGILATIIAAGIAVYYILSLSADLREARDALHQSQLALARAETHLSSVGVSLRSAQREPTSLASASSISSAISEVSRSEADIRTASTSIRTAAAKLDTPARADPPNLRRVRRSEVPAAATGAFEVGVTGDGFLSLRSEPDRSAAEIARMPVGALLDCQAAQRNAQGTLWRQCATSDGQSGFVRNSYIQQK